MERILCPVEVEVKQTYRVWVEANEDERESDILLAVQNTVESMKPEEVHKLQPIRNYVRECDVWATKVDYRNARVVAGG